MQPPFAELGVPPLAELRGYPYTRTYWPAATGAVGQACSVRVLQPSFEAGMVPLQLRKNPSLRSERKLPPRRVSHEAFLWGPSPWDGVVSTARMIAGAEALRASAAFHNPPST